MAELLSADHAVRTRALHGLRTDDPGWKVLTAIHEIELSLTTSRNASMYIRKAAIQFPTTPAVQRATICFLFGLLGYNFTSIWEDIYLALADIAPQDEYVLAVALEWLETENRGHAIRLMAHIPGLAQRHARRLVPLMLEMRPWLRKDQLLFLGLFAKFANPKVFFRPDDLYACMLEHLTSSDAAMQKGALSVIVTWKAPEIKPYETHLVDMLDNVKFREEMNYFQDSIQSAHRHVLMPVLLRLMYGRSLSKTGSRRGKRTVGSFRSVVIHALTRLPQSDVEVFIKIAVGPAVSWRQQNGVLSALEDMLTIMGTQFTPYIGLVVPSVLSSLTQTSQLLVDGQEVGETKLVRGLATKCLLLLFRGEFDWEPFMTTIFSVLSPRLPKFASENAEAVSTMLQLFASWATPLFVHFLEYDAVLPQILRLLHRSKEDVKTFVLTMYQDIISIDSDVSRRMISASADDFLSGTLAIIQTQPSKCLLESTLETIFHLAPYMESSAEAVSLLRASQILLKQPSGRVGEQAKGHILGIVIKFVPLADLDDALHSSLVECITDCMGFWKGRKSRQSLASAYRLLEPTAASLGPAAADIVDALNSYETDRVEEPDFERRLGAFADIRNAQFTSAQWQPILANLFFFMGDEELAIRTSATAALNTYVAINVDVWKKIIAGVTSRSELVRAEYLAVVEHMVVLHDAPFTEDLRRLRIDDESSFFTNILHIQQHRRFRAVQRLGELARKRIIGSENAQAFFIPLLQHFVLDPAADGQNLSNEAVQTIGALSQCLKTKQFERLLADYTRKIRASSDAEVLQASRPYIRLSRALIDALVAPDSTLELSAATIEKFLPPLTKFLQEKDESAVSIRVPVFISVVKLIKLLPDRISQLLPPVLTDLSHILRSRDQTARDMTRNTLVEISGLLGPTCLGFIISELRGSLKRGYQMHVLAFTVHAILVQTLPTCTTGDIDYCIPDIVAVLIEDVFGVIGQEKDADGYHTTMKEIKSRKSPDSMQLLAEICSPQHLGDLIRPLESLLNEKMTLAIVRKADDLLQRINSGILKNPQASEPEMLVFCYEIIRSGNAPPAVEARKTPHKLIKLVAIKNSDSTASYAYKLSRFGLDLLRGLVSKQPHFLVPKYLDGFIPVVSDTFIQSHEEVQIAAIRLLTVLIKHPLGSLQRDTKTLAAQTMTFLKSTPSTTSDFAQACLKFMSAILKERGEVKDSSISYLITRIQPDLEEPDRQGSAFNFLRSVMDKKILVPELYEIMDTVRTIMITNHNRPVRDLARGAYIQFLMDYPQGKKRFDYQLAFLVKNLDYQHKEGRQSVMEVIHQLLLKVGGELLQDITQTFFTPLILSLANDNVPECREMTSILVKEIFVRSEKHNFDAILGQMRNWLQQPHLAALAIQCFVFAMQARSVDVEKDVPIYLDNLEQTLEGDEWSALYLALQAVKECCQSFSTLCFTAGRSHMWNAVTACLSYPHAWIRRSSSRVIGTYLATFTKGAENLGLPLQAGELSLAGRQLCFLTSKSLAALSSLDLGDELATQTVKNLAFMGRCFAFNNTPWMQQEEDSDSEDEEVHSALSHIFYVSSKIIRNENAPFAARLSSKMAALRLVATLCSQIPNEALVSLADLILVPIYNLTDASVPQPFMSIAAPESAERQKELILLAQEVANLIREKLGASEYAAVYSQIRERAKAKRDVRRNKRRIEAISDPARAEVSKRKKHDRKKERRREKGADFRERRRGY